MAQFPFDNPPSFDSAGSRMASTTANKQYLLKLLQKGQAHQQRGEFKEAEHCYQLVLRDDAKNAEALNLLGVLVVEAEQYDMSIKLLLKAIRQKPKSAKFRNNLANSYILNDQPELAVPHLRKALARSPGLIEALMNMTRAYREMGKWKSALGFCEKALKRDPDFTPARVEQAGIMVDSGDTTGATVLFRQILHDKPGELDAMIGLAGSHKFTRDDKEIKLFEAALSEGGLTEDKTISLLHIAGKYYNDIKDYDNAFARFAKAKDMAGLNFDLTAYRKHVDQLSHLFTPLHFIKYQGAGSESERPVFIVGMPRSGTTLTEQIIASHPKAFGAGELPDIGVITGKITQSHYSQATFYENQKKLTADQIAHYAERYLSVLNRHSRQALRVVDKMPHNFEALGLIAMLFPRARIIHCKRDPMDNCMSVFTHHFSEAHGYNTSLEKLGLYYREYNRLMDHWKAALPLDIFELQYENMIADQEGMTRKLIDFLGLEWDDACLDFHQTARSVQTISQWQVRQPIYTTSVKRWKHYDKHLGPLKQALGDLFVDD
jgi:tetratricopeptide (TPR) repeat protein